MPSAVCIFCHQPKPELSCGACLEPVCKGCVLHFDAESLKLRSEKPAALSHSAYCPACYDRHVSPALAEYEATLARAREACVWSKNYRGHIPILKKSRKPVEAVDVAGKDELVLQLAFCATEMGFNALTGVEITSRKSSVNGYQKTLWSGRGLPVLVDAD